MPFSAQLYRPSAVRNAACRTMGGTRTHPVDGIAVAGLASIGVTAIYQVDAELTIGDQLVRVLLAPA